MGNNTNRGQRGGNIKGKDKDAKTGDKRVCKIYGNKYDTYAYWGLDTNKDRHPPNWKSPLEQDTTGLETINKNKWGVGLVLLNVIKT